MNNAHEFLQWLNTQSAPDSLTVMDWLVERWPRATAELIDRKVIKFTFPDGSSTIIEPDGTPRENLQ
jgi:hypothetical protein